MLTRVFVTIETDIFVEERHSKILRRLTFMLFQIERKLRPPANQGGRYEGKCDTIRRAR